VLAQLLTSSPPSAGFDVVDRITSMDETAVAKNLFKVAGLVLAANELSSGFGKVKDMDKEFTLDAAIVAASFLKTLQATSKVLLPALFGENDMAQIHEHEVAEALFATGLLTLGIHELSTNWNTVVDIEKQLKVSTAVAVSKFVKVLEKTLKTVKSSMGSIERVR
jgi:hypothetical protein